MCLRVKDVGNDKGVPHQFDVHQSLLLPNVLMVRQAAPYRFLDLS